MPLYRGHGSRGRPDYPSYHNRAAKLSSGTGFLRLPKGRGAQFDVELDVTGAGAVAIAAQGGWQKWQGEQQQRQA